MKALKEGWDCSFAYVFCSVSRIRSAVDVEQLLGRVLRMPYAKRRQADELNRAYAFLSEPSFGEAARALVDKLVEMGFDEEEARDSIEQAQAGLGADDDLLSGKDVSKPAFKHMVPDVPELISALTEDEGVAIRRDREGGKTEIVVVGHFDVQLETKIAASLPEPERKEFAKAVARYRAETQDALSPAERGRPSPFPV